MSDVIIFHKDDGGYQQSGSNDYPSYGGGNGGSGGGGYRDRGYGRQDRYNQESRYDSRPQVNDSGKIYIYVKVPLLFIWFLYTRYS